ncbi:MAG: Dipeptide transport system permease protein DppB, partial [uncultured Rubrobacteraceae bacterium]
VLHGAGDPRGPGPDPARPDGHAGGGGRDPDAARPRQASRRPVPALSAGRGDRGPRGLDRHGPARHGHAAREVSGDVGAGARGAAFRRRHRGAHWGDRGSQAVLPARQDHLRYRADRGLDADFLARDDLRRDLHGEPRDPAVPRKSRQRGVVHELHRRLHARHPHHAELPRLLGRAEAPGHAGRGPRHDPDGRDNAHDQEQHARGDERGLRKDRQGEGRRAVAGRLQARPAQRDAADGHRDRPPVRPVDGRGHPDGDDLYVERDRAVRHPVHRRPRLRRHPGRGPLRRGLFRARQPARGRALRRPRPAGEVV